MYIIQNRFTEMQLYSRKVISVLYGLSIDSFQVMKRQKRELIFLPIKQIFQHLENKAYWWFCHIIIIQQRPIFYSFILVL